jgi:hypothetical protein
MITAVYAGNYRQVKDGAGKGKLFHLYDLMGPADEMEDYINSPQFKQYPVRSKAGLPQFRTMYIDALNDSLPLYKKQDGNYTLDASETNKQVAKLDALRSISPSLEAQYATRLVDKMTGQVSQKLSNALFGNEPAGDKPADFDAM